LNFINISLNLILWTVYNLIPANYLQIIRIGIASHDSAYNNFVKYVGNVFLKLILVDYT
jgi:hypothetical protein